MASRGVRASPGKTTTFGDCPSQTTTRQRARTGDSEVYPVKSHRDLRVPEAVARLPRRGLSDGVCDCPGLHSHRFIDKSNELRARSLAQFSLFFSSSRRREGSSSVCRANQTYIRRAVSRSGSGTQRHSSSPSACSVTSHLARCDASSRCVLDSAARRDRSIRISSLHLAAHLHLPPSDMMRAPRRRRAPPYLQRAPTSPAI